MTQKLKQYTVGNRAIFDEDRVKRFPGETVMLSSKVAKKLADLGALKVTVTVEDEGDDDNDNDNDASTTEETSEKPAGRPGGNTLARAARVPPKFG